MKSSILRFCLGMIVLGFTASAAWAQTQAGAIKVAKVTGTVTIVAADGSQHAATDGAVMTETDTVVTAANSGVVLVFMNGSSVKLGANSRLLVEEFKMDPLGSDIAVGKLKTEPSTSQTKLNLAYGDMVGDVKKLSKNSTYGIKTPVGAAGIRGTTFRIVFTPPANGQPAAFTLSTAEGLVVFTSTAGRPVEVPSGAEVVATAEVNTAAGTISNVQVVSQGISTEASNAIKAAVTEVMSQAQQALFTPAEQTPGNGNQTGNSGNAGNPPPTSNDQNSNAAGSQGPAQQPTPPASTIVQPVSPVVVSPSA